MLQPCVEKLQGKSGSLDHGKFAFFLEYECDSSVISIAYFGEISRTQMANIVIGCDALICLWFLTHTALLSYWIKRESRDGEKEFVQMTDFAVRVGRLPVVESYDQLDELAASLSLHIAEVVNHEQSVFLAAEKQTSAPADIVSINFAERPFRNYMILLKIDQLVQEGQRYRTKLRNEKRAVKRSNIERNIERVREAIRVQTKNYLNSKEGRGGNGLVKNAFVVFRTMEGAARLI